MKRNGELNMDGLRPPNVKDMRNMRTGETRIFRIGRNGRLTLAGSVAAKIGGEFTQQVLILVDPLTATANRVFAVTCLRGGGDEVPGINEIKTLSPEEIGNKGL